MFLSSFSDRYKICLVLLLCWLTLITYSDTVSGQEQVLSEHEKMLKQGLDQLEDQIAPLQERPDTFLEKPTKEKVSLADTKTSGECFSVDDIEVTGVTLFTPSVIEQIEQPYLKLCLGLEHINALIAELSNLYLEHGYVTSRAYIQPQDLSDGTLELIIVEGQIEDIVLSPQTIPESALEWAFPVSKLDVLNIRDLEQGIENLNTNASNNAKVDLRPGEIQGQTNVVIVNSTSKTWQGSVGVNNFGVESTGEHQLDANLVVDNLVGISDKIFFSGSTNIGGHSLPHALSRSYAISWAFPVGYWYASVQNNYYEYEQTVTGDVLNFSIDGSSMNTSLKLGRTLFRDQLNKLDVSASFIRKNSKNYIEDVFLETSSRVLHVWDLSVDYLHHLPRGTMHVGGSIQSSVPWFDAKRQLVSAEDDYQFTKYLLTATYNTQFNVGTQPVIYSLSGNVLYSPKVILASEALTVGGRYTVRGFSQNSLFGYKGAYVRNDFAFPVEDFISGQGRLQYSVGIDAGFTNLPEYPDRRSEWIAGAVAGVQWHSKNISVIATYARAVRVPDFLSDKQQEIDVSLRVRF